MTLKDCIDIVDNIKPNQYTIKDKVMWLSFIEEIIINEVLKTHEGYDGRYDNFGGYSEDRLTIPLVVPSPYDRLYTEYLKMMIDKENGETARYNNSAMSYNTYMMEYRKHYNKTHMPLDIARKRSEMPKRKVSSGLTDAEYENLVRDMTHILTEYFGNAVSEDKLYDAVTKFAQNNLAMLKGKDGRDGVDGKDGYTPRKNIDYFDGAKGPKGDKGEKGDKGDAPIKGIDYFTEEEKEEFLSQPREVIHLANGKRIESREDGIFLVIEDEERDVCLLNADGDIEAFYAETAGEAYTSFMASVDESERPLKGTFVDELDVGGRDSDVVEVELGDGYVVSLGLVDRPIDVLLPPKQQYQYVGFESAIYFSTPSAIPEGSNYTQFPDAIYFKGDSTDNGAFVPEPNMRYTIVFDFDGYMLNGYVSGVTTV